MSPNEKRKPFSSRKRFSLTSAQVVCLLVVVGLFASLLGCDSTATLAPTAPTSLTLSAITAPTSSSNPVATNTSAVLGSAATASTPQATNTASACSTPSLVGTLALMNLPGNVRDPSALAALDKRIFVVGRASNNVGVIENDQLTKIIAVGDAPSAIVSDESLGRLFVLNARTPTLSMLDGDKVLATIPISDTALTYQTAGAMIGDARTHRLFVGLNGARPQVAMLDAQAFTVTNRIFISTTYTLSAMAVDSATDRLYVSHFDAISVIDLKTLRQVETLKPSGDSYQSTYRILIYDAASHHLFADYFQSNANGSNENRLMVIENGKAIASVPIGSDPSDARIVNGRLYVSNHFSNTVSVIDVQNNQVIGTVNVGLGPRALLGSPTGDKLYVALAGTFGYSLSRLEVVNTKAPTVSALIPLSAEIEQFVADAKHNRIYALVPSANALIASDGDRVLSTTPLQRAPVAFALDDVTNKLYVADYLANTVSVVDASSGQVAERTALALPTHAQAIAVDRAHNQIIVNNRTYSLDQLAPTGRFTLTGGTIPFGEGIIPDHWFVNPTAPRAYAIASNGIPGSNGGVVQYPFDTDGMKQLGINYERNVTAFTLDGEAQRVYAASTHPLALTTKLSVLAALTFNTISALELPTVVSALTLNAQTHHLFMSYVPYAPKPSQASNSIEVLDTRTLGRVNSFSVNAQSNAMTVLGERVFIASRSSPALQIARDCTSAAPYAPTPTPTPTPFPTIPPAPTFTTAPTRIAPTATRIAPTPAPLACNIPVAAWAQENFKQQSILNYATQRLGCPLAIARNVNMAVQNFSNGVMFWREDTRKIYVIYLGNTWEEYDDTWDASQPVGGAETPPSSVFRAPIRGFGKVWREQLGGPNARIGWAMGGEIAVADELQDFERGVAFKPNGSLGGIDVLFADTHTWV